jgi:hypothetical protein
MIKGIGIDSVQISRIAQWLEKPWTAQTFFPPPGAPGGHEPGPWGPALLWPPGSPPRRPSARPWAGGSMTLHLKEICVENDEMGKPHFSKWKGRPIEVFETPGRGKPPPLHHPRRGHGPGLCGLGGISAEENILFFQKRDPMSGLRRVLSIKEEMMTGGGRMIAGNLDDDLRRHYEPSKKFGEVFPSGLLHVHLSPLPLFGGTLGFFSRWTRKVIPALEAAIGDRKEYILGLFPNIEYAQPRGLGRRGRQLCPGGHVLRALP